MRSRLLAALGTTLAVLSGGCGTDTPAPAAVGWVDDVCGSLVGFSRVNAERGPFDAQDPVARARSLQAYVEAAVPALNQGLDELAQVGPSPVEGGDALVAGLSDRLGRYRDGFATVRDGLADLDYDDPDAVAEQLPEVLAPFGELSALPPPTVDLDPSTELGQAAEQAPNCRAIRTAPS
jgi:hypothetical protein